MQNQTEEKKFYTCKYDRPFKEIFLNEKNKHLLKGLLETISKATGLSKEEIEKLKQLKQMFVKY